jgi:hypothetical protein
MIKVLWRQSICSCLCQALQLSDNFYSPSKFLTFESFLKTYVFKKHLFTCTARYRTIPRQEHPYWPSLSRVCKSIWFCWPSYSSPQATVIGATVIWLVERLSEWSLLSGWTKEAYWDRLSLWSSSPDETLAALCPDDTHMYKCVKSVADCENLQQVLTNLDFWSQKPWF